MNIAYVGGFFIFLLSFFLFLLDVGLGEFEYF